MKKFRLTMLMAATLVIVLNFSSCGKYEDGPAFTFRSKKGRLSGEWEIVKVGNQTISGYEVVWEFEKDGDWSQNFSYSYGGSTYSYTYNGDWEWKSSKEELEISYNDGGTVNSQRFEILRLTNKELWLEDEQNEKWELEAK